MMAHRFDADTFHPEPGITLIEASAGTGKTHNIMHIVGKLIQNGHCSISEVLILTFTETATEELRTRLRSHLTTELEQATKRMDERPISALSRAIDDFDSASIFTIHGFCNRILREFSVEADLGSEFAILKKETAFKEALHLQIGRELQRISEHNAWVALGAYFLGINSSFISNVLDLKDAEDLPEPISAEPEMRSWFMESFAKLESAWKVDQQAIRQELLSDTAPIARRRKCYRMAELENSLEKLDCVFSGEAPFLDFFETLETLTQRSLLSVCKQGKTIVPNAFYQTCESVSNDLKKLTAHVVQHMLFLKQTQIEQLNFNEQELRFDDLLMLSQKLATEDSGRFARYLNKSYKVALIDEFQDTDPVQFSIIEQVFVTPPSGCEVRPLILIGDPKQAIYGFRGGDIFTYNAARLRAQSVYFLDTNWRSAPLINEAVNELLQCTSHPFVFPWINYAPVASVDKNAALSLATKLPSGQLSKLSGIEWSVLDETTTESEILEALASSVKERLSDTVWLQKAGSREAFKASHIAILVVDNAQGAKVRLALHEKGIPATIYGGASVFESQEALQLYQLLEAVVDLSNASKVRAAVTGAMFTPGLLASAFEPSSDAWANILGAFSRAREQWEAQGLSYCINQLELDFSLAETLAASKNAHRALANYHHLTALLLEYDNNEQTSPYELLEWFRDNLNDPDRKDADQLLKLESDADAVNIMTMHKSKGLEFPVVYVPFLPEVRSSKGAIFPYQFHAPNSGDRQTSFSAPATSENNDSDQFNNEVSSEALRTLYVALTRTEIWCHVFAKPLKVPKSKKNNAPLSILHNWLPDGASMSEQVAKLSCIAKSEPLPDDQDSWLSPREKSGNSETNITAPSVPQIPATMRHLSFTSIVHKSRKDESRLSDEPQLFSHYTKKPNPDFDGEPTLFLFDRGTNAGLLMHEILEQVDFATQENWDLLVSDKLIQFGYDPQLWQPVLTSMLEQLSLQPMNFSGADTFKLADVSQRSLFRETEFSYTAEWTDPVLQSLYNLFGSSEWTQSLGIVLPEIKSTLVALDTFVNGVVDCWFIHQDKVYLLDWKSNYLGGSYPDYAEHSLNNAMGEHHYHLQYLLYICALNRYLRLVMPDYDYAKHFGGVGYCFLRGVQKGLQNSGWFITCPPADFVYELESVLQPAR